MIDTAQTQKSIFPTFLKYVSANVLGMIGFSCYILADTFSSPGGIGSDALAALNLTLPAYSLMNGTGLMIGMGGAARYSLSFTHPDSRTHRTVFTHALLLAGIAALFFSLSGAFGAEMISSALGADSETIGYASDYIRILLLFAPLFLGNNLLLCFVRNDGAPRISMTGMLVGSLANIVLDYIFIYPLDMGMAGAAIATATCSGHQYAYYVHPFYKEKQPVPPHKDQALLQTGCGHLLSRSVFPCTGTFLWYCYHRI